MLKISTNHIILCSLLLTTPLSIFCDTPNGIIQQDHQATIEDMLGIVDNLLYGAPEEVKKSIRNEYANKIYKTTSQEIYALNPYNNKFLNDIIKKYAAAHARKEMHSYTGNQILINNFSNDWALEVQKKLNNGEVIGSYFSHTLKNHVKNIFNEPTPQQIYVPVAPKPSAPSFDYDPPLSSYEQQRKVCAEKYEDFILSLESNDSHRVLSQLDKDKLLYFFYQSILHTNPNTPIYNPPTFHLKSAAKDLYCHKVENVKICLMPYINNKKLLEEACAKVKANGLTVIEQQPFNTTVLKRVFNLIEDAVYNEISETRCCICFKIFTEDSIIGSANKIVTKHAGTGTSCKAATCKECLSKPDCKKYQCQNCTTPINKADLDAKLKASTGEQTYRKPL